MPPKYQPNTEIYSTEISGRSPFFKVHTSLKHARAALSYGARHRGGWAPGRVFVIYKLGRDNEWVEFERFDPKRHCVICGCENAVRPVMINRTGSIADLRVACYRCRYPVGKHICVEYPYWEAPSTISPMETIDIEN